MQELCCLKYLRFFIYSDSMTMKKYPRSLEKNKNKVTFVFISEAIKYYFNS